ncbi:hypothetical protein MMC10_008501 [Thelotrema lepadinum]|nr:hypothetical protein [Thelotrema lepadinum]
MAADMSEHGDLYDREIHEAYEAFKKRNARSDEALVGASRHLPGGNTRSSLTAAPFSLVFESGHGTFLTSVDGDTYLDFLGEYSAGIFGHNNKAIRKAVEEALSTGWNYGGHSIYEQKLAEMVCNRFGPAIELVRFTNSGTEANMCAIGTAMAYTNRSTIMVFDGGYHGSTIAFSKTYGPNAINLPHKWIHGVYDDIAKTESVLREMNKTDLAAILIEPMQGNAGARPCSVPFLKLLRAWATDVGALLIFDEVQASRLSYHGYNQKLGVRPDIMTLGKWVGGGMTFGAFGGRKDVMEMYNPEKGKLTHAGTFNNNIISMAAGCAGMKLLDEGKIERLNILGCQLKDKVNHVISEKGLNAPTTKTTGSNGTKGPPDQHRPSHASTKSNSDASPTNGHAPQPRIWISAVGSILNLGFNGPGALQLQSLFYHHMLSRNIYMASRGFIALNIETNEEHIQAFVDGLTQFIDRYKSILEAV